MNYEQKYKNALERARDLMTNQNPPAFDKHLIEMVFPELAESEDERIRKAIKKALQVRCDGSRIISDEPVTLEEAIAWLEKQGDKIVDCQQNHQDVKHPNGGITMEDFNGGEGFYKLHLDYLSKKQVEEVEEMVRMWNKESKTSNENIKTCVEMCLTDANEQRFEDFGTSLKDCLAWLEKQGKEEYALKSFRYKDVHKFMQYIEKQAKAYEFNLPNRSYDIYAFAKDILIWFEKQGEKKPTDKAEPKFKVGDFITNDYCLGKVIEITNDAYLLDTGQGIPFSCEHNAHLWTIQDAKNGDVLVSDEVIFIFNKIHDVWVNCHCSLHKDGSFCDENYDLIHIKYAETTYPATKEARDLLFEKMKEAGYEWDAEKKELKKFEVKKEAKKLDADKVIEWIEGHVPTKFEDMQNYVEQFKEAMKGEYYE